jgi:signal transduction histidine kinase
MARGFSIRAKIVCSITVPALMLILVIYLDYVHLNSLGQSAELILSKNYRTIKAGHQIRQLLELRHNFVLFSLVDPKQTDGNNVAATGPQILRLLQVCTDNITESGEQEIIERLSASYQRYDLLFASFFDGGSSPTQSKRSYSDIFRAHTSVDNNLDALISINEEAMEAAEAETKKVAKRAQKYSMVLLLAAILFTTTFSLFVAKRISGPLVNLAESLAAVKEGSGDYPRFHSTSKDEIGFLTSEFNRLFERLKVYDQLSLDRLTAERLKVRQAELAKARFVADLSHQLKTPMTSLSMSIGILAEKKHETFSGKHAQLLETAKEDCNRLSGLIAELLDLSRLDAMLKPWPKEIMEVEQVIDKCLAPLRHQAEEKGIQLRTEFASGLPAIAIDSFRFPWVITNLVGNAIRYSDRGGHVALRVEKRGGRFYFQCADTGIGIEEKYLPGIFDRFTQFSEREKMGTIGLGLAIVKEVIEQHGGDISVESKVGKGTTFSFWIPIQTEDVNGESSGS